MQICLRGNCPVQNKPVKIYADLIYPDERKIGIVDCDYIQNGNKCSMKKCPIVEQNSYRQ